MIRIVSAIGKANYNKLAFDKALRKVEINNYNLIELSSVIPEGEKIRRKKSCNVEAEIGSLLPVVQARDFAEEETSFIGLGWVNSKERNGGIIVEEHSEDEEKIKEAIEKELDAMQEYRELEEHTRGKEILKVEPSSNYEKSCGLVLACYPNYVIEK